MAPMATGTHAATGAAGAATGATRGGQPGVGGGKSDRRRNSITSPLHQRTSKWDEEELEEQDLEEGVRVGDPRKSTFLLPSFDDDSEGEEETR